MKTKEKKFLSQVALAVFVTFSGVTAEAREKVSLNLGWKYQLGIIENAQSVAFNDKGWQMVNFPHNILDNSNKSCSFASEIKKV